MFAALLMVGSICICATADEELQETPIPAETGASDEELAMRTSASIRALFEVDTKKKEYWFRFPPVDRALQPWHDLRTRLNNDHGFRPNISATHVYQKA
jgi:hypothetical protein